MARPSEEAIKMAVLLDKAITKAAAEQASEREEALDPRLYLIQGVSGGPIKIGIAKHVEKRCAELQRTSPIKLRVLATFDGGLALERLLHERFVEWRLHGEWFDEDCPELAALATALGPFLDLQSNAPAAHFAASTARASTKGA